MYQNLSRSFQIVWLHGRFTRLWNPKRLAGSRCRFPPYAQPFTRVSLGHGLDPETAVGTRKLLPYLHMYQSHHLLAAQLLTYRIRMERALIRVYWVWWGNQPHLCPRRTKLA